MSADTTEPTAADTTQPTATPSSSAAVLAGCEPWSSPGGDGPGAGHGVLVCHGYTGCPQSMRPLAEAFARAGFAVELPLWPGHGVSADDLAATTFGDWAAAAEAAYQDLAARCDKVVLAGLSMGGFLATWTTAAHPEVAALVTINAMAERPAQSFVDLLQQMLDQGIDRMPAVGSDIAMPGSVEKALDATPIAPLMTIFAAEEDLLPRLADIRCPVLVMHSPQDHVVPPTSSDVLAERIGGPVERLVLDRSYHVATLDHDAPLIEKRAVEFAVAAVAAVSG